ncbi:MAG: PQQ-dependent sugar dehydrogenase, partial [Bacteroidota bacterium]
YNLTKLQQDMNQSLQFLSFWLRSGILSLLFFYFFQADLQAQTFSDTSFQVQTVVSGLPNDVIGFTSLPDGRFLFIGRAGDVSLLPVGGALTKILDLPGVLTQGNGEQGLLGIAVHPSYPDSNFVYLFFTRADSINEVSRFKLEGDLSDSTSVNLSVNTVDRQILFEISNETQFHQAGTLRFGPDSMLYISLGDDARKVTIQDYRNFRGKILRVNPNGSFPDDNPVFSDAPSDALGGIYAIGLRNPFRFAIDPKDGSLLIGDVGAVLREEVDLAYGGENFGWPKFEGDSLTLDTINLVGPAPTAPLIDYQHAPGSFSVIGISVYRPSEDSLAQNFPPPYDGALFYADYFRGPLYALIPDSVEGYRRVEFAEGFRRVVDASLTADGGMLLLESGQALRKVTYFDTTSVDTSVTDTGDVTSIDPRALTSTEVKVYPNPFTQAIQLELSMPAYLLGQSMSVEIYNTQGQKVASLFQGKVNSTQMNLLWDGVGKVGRFVPAGVYYYRIKSATDLTFGKLLKE